MNIVSKGHIVGIVCMFRKILARVRFCFRGMIGAKIRERAMTPFLGSFELQTKELLHLESF